MADTGRPADLASGSNTHKLLALFTTATMPLHQAPNAHRPAHLIQAMRSAYGDPPEAGSSGVRLTLDTNVVMLKENPYSAMASDRCSCFLLPSLPVLVCC